MCVCIYKVHTGRLGGFAPHVGPHVGHLLGIRGWRTTHGSGPLGVERSSALEEFQLHRLFDFSLAAHPSRAQQREHAG